MESEVPKMLEDNEEDHRLRREAKHFSASLDIHAPHDSLDTAWRKFRRQWDNYKKASRVRGQKLLDCSTSSQHRGRGSWCPQNIHLLTKRVTKMTECLRSSSSTVWHGGIQAVCMPDPVNIPSVTRPFVSKEQCLNYYCVISLSLTESTHKGVNSCSKHVTEVNDKDPSHLQLLSPGMGVNTRYIISTRGRFSNLNLEDFWFCLMSSDDKSILGTSWRLPLVEFMYLVFTRMPGESYCRWFKSLLLYLCYMFWALISSLVCWFCTCALHLIPFQIFVPFP